MSILGIILIFFFVVGLISCCFAKFICSTGLAFAASATTLVILLTLLLVGILKTANESYAGIYFLLLFFIPCIFPTSFGFVVLTKHKKRKFAKSLET